MEFQELFNKISPKLRKLADNHKVRGLPVDRDDLYQEMCIHLWNNFRNRSVEGVSESYIIRGCLFHMLNYLRKQKRKACLVSLEEPVNEDGCTLADVLQDGNGSPAGYIDTRITIEDIRDNGFTEREKQVFSLLLLSHTVREIGRELGISHTRVVKIKNALVKKWREKETGGMKRIKMAFVIALLWQPAVCLVFNRLSFATPSTHIWAPSADIQPYKKWHLTADFYFPAYKSESGKRPKPVKDFGLTAGLLPFERLNMEAGFDYKSGLGGLDDYPVYFNAKMGVPEGAFGKYFPTAAAGIYEAGTEHNKTDYNIIYAKIAKTLYLNGLNLGRFSAGYFRGNPELLRDAGGGKDNKGLLAAWERALPEISDKLWVCIEYMGSQSSYGSWNAGFSWKFSDGVSAILGYDIYNDRGLANTVTLQLDIDL